MSASSSSFSTATAMEEKATKRAKHGCEYDFVVIGGGSGGLAASKEAVKLNPDLKVACFDFVQPSHQGTKWGLGGTCVNVGCVPKKLMHYSSLLGHHFDDAREYGWLLDEKVTHDWNKMRTLVTDYIRSLNFTYKAGLRSAKVNYIEGYARMVDKHTISWMKMQGGKLVPGGKLTADKVLVATGGRPELGNIPGAELAITSDDLFWLKKTPGKTLVIGAGYIALECAGLLKHLGLDVSVMVRGEILRKMDQQCAQQLGELMERDGVRFIIPASPVRFTKAKSSHPVPPEGSVEQKDGTIIYPDKKDGFTYIQYPSGALEKRPNVPAELAWSARSTWKLPEGKIIATYKYNNATQTQVLEEEFDTVLLAIGRNACVQDLGITDLGVQLKHGKIQVDEENKSSVDNIYAVGDVAIGKAEEFPELTPVAIQAGQYIVRRLYAGSKDKLNYRLVPTTVFTPTEYGFTGLSQEAAERDVKEGGIGKENVEVWWSRFGHLEISPTHPHPTTLRSSAFTGANLWMRKYCEKQGLWWADVGFTEGGQVLVECKRGVWKQGTIQNIDGNYCDVLLDDAKDVKAEEKYDFKFDEGAFQGVPQNKLKLTPEGEAEKAEVFAKSVCLAKLVCDKRTDQVLGIHFIGPNAGEVMQGLALGLHFGVKKENFDKLTGIHPTAAEEFCVLGVNKSSGKSFMKKAGCGGGTCG